MRFAFGGTSADYAITTATVNDTSNTPRVVAVFEPAAPISFWNAAVGGTQYLDLVDLGGAPLTTVLADDNGWIPELQGPDGVTVMYASAQGGARVKLIADLSGATGDMNAAIQTVADQAVATEAAAREQGDADTLAAANAYTDTHGGSATAPVYSVNGKTGDVTLAAADVGARPAADAVPATEVSGLAAVARSGAYVDLTNRPTLAPVATSGLYDDLTNRPDVYSKTDSDARYAPSVAPRKPASLTNWFRAVDSRLADGLDILVVGDSWSEGKGGSTTSARYLDKLRDLLRAQLSPSYLPGGYGYMPSWLVYQGANQFWTYTGTTTQQTVHGLGLRNVRLSAGATASVTFTGTGFQLYYATGASGGAFTYSIDGGAESKSINTEAPQAVQDGAGVTLYSLDPGQHTLKITVSTNYLYLEGLMPYNGDAVGQKGLRIWDGAHSGWEANDFVTKPLAGPTSNPWYSAIRNVRPNLVMVELGINDWRHGTEGAALFKTNLGTLVQNVRLLAPSDPALLFWLCPQAIPSGSETETWGAFRTAASEAAAAVGAYVFDAATVVPDYVAGGSMWNADGIHPNDAGHAALANALAPILLP